MFTILARLLLAVALLLGWAGAAFAQSQSQGMCPGCPAMGGGMLLFGLLAAAGIAALVALTIFLVRRSKSPK